MPEIVWLPDALEDIRRLRLFLQDKNPAAAQRIAATLLDGCATLLVYPESGRPMNDETGRRELACPFGAGAYVLRYMLDGQTVVIIRVWHSREQRD